MKRKHYAYSLVCSLLMCFFSYSGYSQIYLTADSTDCGATSTTIRATVIGDAPTGAGITADDGYSGVISIGFTFNFYGTNYTQLCIGSNGMLNFNTSVSGGYCPWPISAALLGNASARNCICGPWCDMFIPAGGTITYSTVGTAPYRKFVATWCATRMYSCTTQWTTSQIIIYETTNLIETHIGHKTICSWNGGYAIVGVQNNAGTAATAAPGRDWPATWTATNEAWRFTPNTAFSAYTCSSIPYATVPYSSSTVHWYDSATGAYLGSGSSLTVSPTVPTTYKATAAGCSDSTFSFIHVDLSLGAGSAGSPVHITSLSHTNPTECGRCNASVTLTGINPHQIDSIFYSIGGVPQPILVDSAMDDSIITINNLCAGVYDYFYVKVGRCRSNSIPVTIVDPAFTAGFTLEALPGCTNDSVKLTNTSSPAGYTSVWTYGDGTGEDSAYASPTHVYAAQGTYGITLIYKNPYGCRDTAYGTVTFDHPLTSVFSPSASSVCLGTPITFTNSSVGNGATFTWDFGDGTSSTEITPTHTYSQAGDFTVVLTVLDTIPCAVSSSQVMNVVSVKSELDFHDTTVCLRDSMDLLARVTVLPSSVTNVTYQWTPASNLSDATITDPRFFGQGVYTYTFTATAWPLGCTGTDVLRIDSKPPLVLTNVTANQTVALGEKVQLNADSAWVYVWSPNDGTLDNTTINNPIATPTDSVTVYTVIGMSFYGCKDTASVTIRVDRDVYEFVPSSFTPNGDGRNDLFRVVNLKYQKLVDFRVYNRWGREVFHTTDATKGWDGTLEGQPQDLGVYYYQIIVAKPDGVQKNYNGSVTLIR